MYNAYILFSKHRTYRLWYRDAQVRCPPNMQDLIRNPHARLEAPPTAAPPRRSWEAWAKCVHVDSHRHMGLLIARQIPIVEWFVPAPVTDAARPVDASERIYVLRVWDVYEAPLWLFTYVDGLTLGYTRPLMPCGGA